MEQGSHQKEITEGYKNAFVKLLSMCAQEKQLQMAIVSTTKIQSSKKVYIPFNLLFHLQCSLEYFQGEMVHLVWHLSNSECCLQKMKHLVCCLFHTEQCQWRVGHREGCFQMTRMALLPRQGILFAELTTQDFRLHYLTVCLTQANHYLIVCLTQVNHYLIVCLTQTY